MASGFNPPDLLFPSSTGGIVSSIDDFLNSDLLSPLVNSYDYASPLASLLVTWLSPIGLLLVFVMVDQVAQFVIVVASFVVLMAKWPLAFFNCWLIWLRLVITLF